MNRNRRVRAGFAHAVVLVPLLTAITIVGAGKESCAQSAPALLKDPIKTDLGFVSGLTIGQPGKEVRVYRGIPYAAPPVGDLRWRPPRPAAPWEGVRKATEYSRAAAQYFPSTTWNLQESQMSEDCLYLNVNTAAKTANDKLPVMVWFHPGGLDTGTANLDAYNSPALVRHGVVLVTVNDRLGPFGLFASAGLSAESPEGASGNYDLLDLISSLQWVRQNIAAFGGDPERVTIFGEGGGAQKVLGLLASPLAKGLFQRAIVEAGTNRDFHPGQTLSENNTRIDTEWESYRVSQKFTNKLGTTDLGQLRAKTWQQIVAAMPAPPTGPETTPAKDDRMHLTIDAWSLMDNTVNTFDEALGNDVPVLIGGDEDELAVFVGYAADWLPAISHQKSPVYVYRFMHVPPKWKEAGAKAPHGMEVRYQFDDLGGTWKSQAGLPQDPGVSKDDETVAENMMRVWVNFAASGNPSVDGLVQWPAFKATPGQDKYVTIDTKDEVQSGFLDTFKPGTELKK